MSIRELLNRVGKMADADKPPEYAVVFTDDDGLVARYPYDDEDVGPYHPPMGLTWPEARAWAAERGVRLIRMVQEPAAPYPQE